ncbi:hypothetical protein [Flavisericum labens]|uniref:hypothetical protein n=1 Tax=Flavisericum labens TaxID=3377112 RepID=UPI00387AD16F
MANVRDLKKDINYVLGDIIEAVYVWEFSNTDKGTEKSEAIIDESIETFDELMAKVNSKTIENPKSHFNDVRNELESRGRALIEKVNNLG